MYLVFGILDDMCVKNLTQFKICINLFGERDVTPSNAVDILLIVDRHSHDRRLCKLKKVGD